VLRSDSYTLHKILPNKVDPLVSLMMVEKVPDSTYEMVGGLDKQIKEIKEVIELPVKHPELFEALGIAQPKGVLLYGPPGTGKTLLARAVAHHTDCKFIRVSGSELVQKYIGEGSRMVRELFVMAREHAPSIIFMDEIDSIGSSRGESGSGGGDSEVQRTMLELLNQLDGFESTKNIKVIMATNRIGSYGGGGLWTHRDLHTPQISSIRRCCVQGGLTARSSSHPQDRKHAWLFFGSIPARFVWL
jgi:26S proteasome regulatory subunit T6